jgi:Lrp/AsnC family leucine-responsive transcriptional regulator
MVSLSSLRLEWIWYPKCVADSDNRRMDRLDREILKLLVADGRLSYRELGERVHLSANAVAERVRRMLKDGTIRSIRADVDPAALDRTLEAQIDVKLRPDTSAADFERAIRLMPQLISATLLTGSYDYVLRVACTDRADLVEVAERLRNQAGALETYSRVVLQEVRLSPWVG